jgi:hypothetical protein
MKPDIQAVLAQTVQVMLQDFAPGAATPYLASQIGMTAFVLSMAVEDFDRAASRRVEENRSIRALLTRSADLGLEPGLAARLAALAAGQDDDLQISSLDAANAALRAALIDLQSTVEARAEPAAAALNDAIWAELADSTERRRFAGANF